MVEHLEPSELDRVFAALADPTRRAILERLSLHPANISEIARPFPVSLNAVSKHIMVLERAGLLHREIRGRQHQCWIEPRPLREADAWLEHYRQFWERRMDALEAYVKRKLKASKRRSAHGNVR